MSELKKVGFVAINDQDESLKGKAPGGSFGLNENCFITKFEYNPNAGKDGSQADAIDIHIMVGEREFRRRFYDITIVFDKDGNQITDTESEEFIEEYNKQFPQINGVVTHTLKSLGVSQDQINNALATPPTNFADWAKIMTSLVPKDFNKKPVDLFLEYQWEIKPSNDRTYLEIPKNMKGGRFLNPSIKPVGSWNIEKEWIEKDDKGADKQCEGLRYVDNAGNVHPFKRTKDYMESPKAFQQLEGQVAKNALNAAVNNNPNSAKQSTW